MVLSPLFVVVAAQVLTALATPNLALQARQSVPPTLPKPWTSLGCYTDNAQARALKGATYVDPSKMTVEFCLSFCTSRGYSHAGVEWGQECFCDQVIQVPSTSTSIGECNMACTGNPAQSCGAGNRINIYYNGAPAPTRPTNIGTSSWLYLGCYSDIVGSRTLPFETLTAGPVTPESCARACADAGHDTMGLEYGHECWCGDNTGSATVRPDHECSMTCDADRTAYCGGSNRLSLFEKQPPPLSPFYPTECLPQPYADFTLFTVLKDSPFSGPRSFILKVIEAGVVGGTTYNLLTACETCTSPWEYFHMADGFLLPRSSNTNLAEQISIDLYQGAGPLWQTKSTLPPFYGGYAGYCAGRTPYRPYGSHVLIGNGDAGNWALCRNLTAKGRLDVVLEPRANHNHYDKRNCDATDIYIDPL